MTSVTLQKIIEARRVVITVFKTYTTGSLSRIVRATRISGIHQTRKPSSNG